MKKSDAQLYREEWANRLGISPGDVYVPKALLDAEQSEESVNDADDQEGDHL